MCGRGGDRGCERVRGVRGGVEGYVKGLWKGA